MTPSKTACLKYYRDYDGYYVWVDEGDNHQHGVTRHKTLVDARKRVEALQKDFGVAFANEDLTELEKK